MTSRHPVRVLALAAAVLTAVATGPAGAITATAPTNVSALGAVAVDGATGHLLWGIGADTPRAMASTTKIMTAIVVLETTGLSLDRLVTITAADHDYVVRNGYSSAGLRVGDRPTVRQLISAMLLPSGCDAAYALADTVGSGATTAARIADFVARMNSKAAALGLTGTRFASVDGNAPVAENYITPRSLALLATYALTNPVFAAVVKEVSEHPVVRTATGSTRTYAWKNSDTLLSTYSGAIGVKTGTSTAAGSCLVFAARRNGRYVVGVVLRSRSDAARFADAKQILNWALG